MPDALRTVHRIRKVEERRARAILAAAELARAEAEARLWATEAAQLDGWDRASGTGQLVDLATHHATALRRELHRRAQEREVAAHDQHAGRCRQALQGAARRSKVVELVADDREARMMAELSRRANATFDEQGLQAWWRRSA
jgi:flagellar export protein FliJ